MAHKKNIYNYKTSKSGNVETHYLLTRGRISRSTFLTRLILALSLFVIFKLINDYYWRIDYPNYSIWSNFYYNILPSFLLAFVCIQAGKRIHDINKSAFYVLIPLLNLYYVSRVGTKGNNEYGIDPSPHKNIKYFDQIDSFDATNASKNNRTDILKIIVLFILGFLLFYGFKNNTGGSSIKGSLPLIDVRMNVKKRDQLNIGFISISGLDETTNSCLLKIFEGASIKFVKKDNLDILVDRMRDNKIDLLLLSPSESQGFIEKFDQTGTFYVKSISRKAIFFIPKENDVLLESLNECITDINVSK